MAKTATSSATDPKGPLDEFLNPKSMLTPGLAGALTMFITNSLAKQFGLAPNYTGLVISFLIGLLVFFSQINIALPARFLYYVLNSLVIFSVAMGANEAGVIGAKQAQGQTTKNTDQKLAITEPFFSHWLDGTVPLRKELMAEINDKVTSDLAIQVLKTLGTPEEYVADPKNLLEYRVARARTADQINQVRWALATCAPQSTDKDRSVEGAYGK
jgi:hypothetical protein